MAPCWTRGSTGRSAWTGGTIGSPNTPCFRRCFVGPELRNWVGMSNTWQRVGRSVVAGLCLLATALRAQNDAASRRAAIEGMYPVMLAALEAKNFGRARNICDQAILWEPQNPVHHYNLACIEAQAGGPRLPYAWGALELAVALGFDDVEHLKTDPDLAPLHSDPKFADLVRKLIYNATTGGATASINAPTGSARTTAKPAEVELPSGATFKDELPVGLFLMTRYSAATLMLEKSVWYFDRDRSVYRGLQNGFSREDVARHKGPRGVAHRAGRTLHIDWADGKTSESDLERDGKGFTWDMAIFTPVVAFENSNDVVGVYEGSEPVGFDTHDIPVLQHLEISPDGTFSWRGAALTRSDRGVVEVSTGNAERTTGQWELKGFSLILSAGDGLVLRRLAFPQDDEKTVIKPDRMYFAGLIYKRRP